MKDRNTRQVTFWNFLQNNKIEIPIIQRDYAQGRFGNEKLREKFLKDLKDALNRKEPYTNEKLKLDFVYGSVENSRINPLDGQQRLTTLWLLHWYVAYKAVEIQNEKEVFKKFTYETRVSSREFCEKLSEFTDPQPPGKDIVDHITNQTWFRSMWKQDPTVKAMLNMLGGIGEKDGLEEIFEGKDTEYFKECWSKLSDPEKCPIVFYYLPLNDFGLSDDLYIKMNARGKALTSFENFKADLVGHIRSKKWEDNKEPEKSIAHKLDTSWTDIFWGNKSKDNRIDEIYFAFLNRYLLNSLIIKKDSYSEKDTPKYLSAEKIEKENKAFGVLYGNQSNDSDVVYVSFDIYKEVVTKDVLESLVKTLDNYYEYTKNIEKENVSKIFFPAWDDMDNFRFIPEYENNNGKLSISTLTQKQRIVFHAISCYFEKIYKVQSEIKTPLAQWMRVVWNIVENGNVENVGSMINVMRLIDEIAEKIAEHSSGLYTFLAEDENNIKSDAAKGQVAEEREKACKILEPTSARIYGKTWEDVIIEAEKTAFFKGAIRLLYRSDKDSKCDWDKFDTRFSNAKKYFDEKGVKDGVGEKEKYRTNALLLKAFISRVENPWDDFIWNKRVFDNDADSWKGLLLNTKLRDIMNVILSGEISIANKGKEEWHRRLYNTELLSYVADRMKGSRIRDIHSHKAIYPPYSQAGIILDMSQRDLILSNLLKREIIEIGDWQKADDKPFFRGWDIKFKLLKYEDKNIYREFIWNTDRNIYLLKEDRDEWAKDGNNNYIFISENDLSNSNVMLKELVDLIGKEISYIIE